jgi:hypothetical protein
MSDSQPFPQPPDPASSQATSQGAIPLFGIRGWLMFFCIVIVVVAPVQSTYALVKALVGVSHVHWHLNTLIVLGLTELVAGALVTAYGVYAGVRLLWIRPDAVRTARRFLVLRLALTLLSAVVPFLVVRSLSTRALLDLVGKPTVQGLIFVAIWYSYLELSKRVRQTYGLDAEVSLTSASS